MHPGHLDEEDKGADEESEGDEAGHPFENEGLAAQPIGFSLLCLMDLPDAFAERPCQQVLVVAAERQPDGVGEVPGGGQGVEVGEVGLMEAGGVPEWRCGSPEPQAGQAMAAGEHLDPFPDGWLGFGGEHG